MLLSYVELCDLISSGVINAEMTNVNGASIDIRIGSELLVENPTLCIGDDDSSESSVIDLTLKPKPGDSLVPMTRLQMGDSGYILSPGQFCLAHSIETFNLPENIACSFFLRSSIARAGLNSLLAGWCDPGWSNSQLTLELHNTLQYHGLLLTTGLRIGQMVFYRVADVPKHRSYAKRGRYNKQSGVVASQGSN